MAKNDEKTRSVWIEERNGRDGMRPITHGPYCRVHGYICRVEFDPHYRAPFLTQYVPLEEVASFVESYEPNGVRGPMPVQLADDIRSAFEGK